MDVRELRRRRLCAHRLSEPAPGPVAAAAHMTATQAQEFWAGRWAIAVRSAGAPSLLGVDGAFERGELVRTWTMRGTLHIVRPQDVGWMLSVTGERQVRQAASVHRSLALGPDDLVRAERALRLALAGGGRLTRGEAAEVLRRAGVDPVGMRGNHVLSALCMRGVLTLGPVVPREGGPSREQYVVLLEEHAHGAVSPADPLAELAVRYFAGHGPATVADLRWWAGLPIGRAREAVVAAGPRIVEVEEGLYDVPRRADAAGPGPEVIALPPWDEYYLAYADRLGAADPDRLKSIGPTLNGLVRPVLIKEGRVIGTWRHSAAVGAGPPSAEPFEAASDPAPVRAALAAFRAFWES